MDPFSPADPPRAIALVGAGRVGTAVATLLARAGHRVEGVWSRSAASAEAAAERLGAPAILRIDDLPPAPIVLMGVSDHAIEQVAADLARVVGRGTIAWHLAGSLGLQPLRALRRRGCFGAALHPVQSCPDVDRALARLPGSAWGVTCDPEVARWAKDVVRVLDGNPVDVAEEDRPRWHAAAVVASNATAALLSLAASLLDDMGVVGEDVLGPLAAGTVANAREAGFRASLTGPVVRGELTTLRRHAEALRGRGVSLADYALATTLVLSAAYRAGRIDAATRDEMERVIRSWT